MERFAGIDPGAKGYICLLVPENDEISFISLAKSPKEIYISLRAINPDIILIEDVHSIHGMSAKSNFSFGKNVGGINWLADLIACPVEHVKPKDWQKEVGISSKRTFNKVVVADYANKIYPSADLYGPRGGLIDGKADALMIAHCCKLRYGNSK